MKPIHEGLPYRSFTYPFLGPNTGAFGITDADIAMRPDSSIFFMDENGNEFPGMVITGNTQPEIYVAPETSGGGGIFSDSGMYTGNNGNNTTTGNNSVIIFG